jgi:dTDP-4-dehydrorhamnose reductase
MKLCILGVSGMLGHMLFSELLRYGFDVYGTVRGPLRLNARRIRQRILENVDALDSAGIASCLDALTPNVVINAIGLIRQLPEGREPLQCIRINAAFPHMLWKECAARGIRCIHYSTDCVFDGKAERPYTERDRPTAPDVYGLTKFLGEIAGPLALTVRTSCIGPELRGKHSLIEWFLAQEGSIHGYTGAIYTGLPTSEHARVLAEYILPRTDLQGLYQVSAPPISKCDLLRLVAQAYGKSIGIMPDDSIQEDKRLSCEAFAAATGYAAPPWTEMIAAMREAHARTAAQWE